MSLNMSNSHDEGWNSEAAGVWGSVTPLTFPPTPALPTHLWALCNQKDLGQ